MIENTEKTFIIVLVCETSVHLVLPSSRKQVPVVPSWYIMHFIMEFSVHVLPCLKIVYIIVFFDWKNNECMLQLFMAVGKCPALKWLYSCNPEVARIFIRVSQMPIIHYTVREVGDHEFRQFT